VPNKSGNPWTILRSTSTYDNPWISVTEHEVLNPAGKPGVYGVVHIKSVATGVVAVDEEGCITLVGQYRFPLRQYSWEIPEGGGRAGDTPLEAAQRELAEETGLEAGEWLPLARLHLSNSVTDEVAHGFLAWDLTQGMATPEETEVLQLRRVPFREAYDMAMSGEITDAIAVACILKVRIMALEGTLPEPLASLLTR
jgi:8-oxo-dGTP pyrophosphatase MutT (NUDIX family)